jgi:Arc/MetJ family transcription regulator
VLYILRDDRYILRSDVTKRLVEIDDDLLARAKEAAGAETIKATVETALRRLADQETVLRHLRRLRRPGALDLDRIEQARRPRGSMKNE